MQRLTLHHPQAERDGTWNDDRYYDVCDDNCGSTKRRRKMSEAVQMVLLVLTLVLETTDQWKCGENLLILFPPTSRFVSSSNC